ncbi:hypothetical protein DEO72_LG9g2612 [Vigna unguiculata]|uniref:Uncharacterized protein n=1 Tax=Vigna unguiculata TaxID=3917 RepID=A0A4D6N3S1_VIGUN|nr:hypothetical protein DEO72_LG9g2612 [Vigna unguiculata]
MVMQETNVFVNNRVFQAPLEPPMVMQEAQISVNNRFFHAQPEQPRVMIPPSRATNAASRSLQGSPYAQPEQPANTDVVEVAQILMEAMHSKEPEVSPNDGTQPYINQLDTPIDAEDFNQDVINDPAVRAVYAPILVNPRREMIPNLLQPIFSRLMVMQETNVFVNNRVFQAPLEPPMVMQEAQISVNNRFFHAQPEQPRVMIPPSRATNAASRSLQGSPYAQPEQPANTDVVEVAQILMEAMHSKEPEVSPNDGTQPYINQLDTPIDAEDFNQDVINGEAPDLNLRL